jgi:hypothetical protein
MSEPRVWMPAVGSDMQSTGEWGSRGIAIFEDISLNNNRGNNRRRGRGNNRQQGGQQLNRIDSRARGNAQQLLDKYKKLAHDAHLNGDRVQEEYYLQFADHYFRVLADQRVRQEESRQRRDGGPQDGGERGRYDDPRGRDYYADFEDDSDEDQARPAADARPRETTPADEFGEAGQPEDNREGAESEPANEYEPADNPFVRDNRPQRAPRQTRSRREPRASEDRDASTAPRPEGGFDPSVLPPAIGIGDEGEAVEEAPKPRRRTRKPRDTDGNDESLEAVG